ncbi:putative ELMO domain-containing protein [Medicago truncatula]|uniref:Putative ELMO domain-containing protein n=1 Tax=Medicago truncatula TaxID=3880 RepID=A0A396GA63_MEDTR|nr:putative ELMO domain-containing protein [Medicago truncatula]
MILASLRALWNAAFPEEELNGLISEQWKDMGWQGKDPSTDFRVVVTYHWRICCFLPGISQYDLFFFFCSIFSVL